MELLFVIFGYLALFLILIVVGNWLIVHLYVFLGYPFQAFFDWLDGVPRKRDS